MNDWWDNYSTLLFKHAVLLKEQVTEQAQGLINRVKRYLGFLKWMAPRLILSFIILVLFFVIFVTFGVQSQWLYQTLTLLMTGVLLVMIVFALPLLVLSEAVYEILPDGLKKGLRAWQRRGAAILFGGLLAVVLIRIFRLWQSPATMLTVLPILAVLWLGGYLGWLKTSDVWRRVIAIKLQIALIVIAVVSVLPGPAGLVEELADWAGTRFEATVFGVTRPTPQRWNPTSVDELQFVDHGTGRYLVWYYRDKEGNYQLFKSKGYDDSGKPLKCAETEAEFTTIRDWQRVKDLGRENARRAQDEQVAKRAVEQAREAERSRLASYVSSFPKARVNYIVFFVDSAGKPSSEVRSAVVDRLSRTKNITAAGNVFTDAFISPQGFDAVVAGKRAADLAAMRIGDAADRLLLIRGSDAKSVPSSSISGLQTYSMRMTISLIDARDGKKLSEFVINDVAGAGLTEVEARATFSERFADTLAARSELLAGLP